MHNEDSLKFTGTVDICHYDENGLLIEERHIPNIVVNVGKYFIASRMIGTASAVMSHMAVGTSNTTPTVSDTTLGAEIALSRTALTSSTQGGGANQNQITYLCTFGPGVGTGALVEAGIFNAASSGTMLCRTTFAVVNKGAGDTVTISWTVSNN